MNRNELEKIASSVMGEDVLEGLKEWYTDTLETRCTYVVFIVRRSYMLALILERLTGKKMEPGKRVHYLTDASMLLHCEEIAEAYRRNQRIPSILLCDDVCRHGRNLNHFIEMIENRLISLLPEYNEADIKEGLLAALRIHVYARSDGPLLLSGKYEFNLDVKRRVSAKFMHGFSSDLSMLISLSGIANASYIYSENVPDEKIQAMVYDDYIETTYQNVTQYTRVKFIGDDRAKKAIFTLRIIKSTDEGCTVLPFVFMPNLGAEETSRMLWMIERRMRDKDIRDDYIERLSELDRVAGKRSFNEAVTLLFSHALLQDFNNRYDITVPEEDRKAEITKLARNYDRYGFEDAEDWLDSILSVQLFTPQEVEYILESTVMPERRMIYISYGSGDTLSREEKKKIKEKIERYFYISGSEEEKEAYVLSRRRNVFERERAERTARGCGFLLWELNDGYTELEAKYSIAYFLQMMDAGAVCLSSFAPNYKRVVGMAQYAKTGEQSLMSEPLKFYEWIPMLSMLEEDCGRDQDEFEEELEKYAEDPGRGLSPKQITEIEQFADRIYYMGHKIQDWNNWNMSYLYKLEIDLPGTEHLSKNKKMSKFLDLQLGHMADYKTYRQYN